jgi:pyruvate dehydrogenase (quinone)
LVGGRLAAGPIHPQHLTAAVDRLAASDAAFTADIGAPTLWAARNLTMNGRRRLIGSFHHGAKPNALSQAIGVQAARPGRQVVALCKGGGSTTLVGDLAALRQLDLPVKIVIFDDGALPAADPCPRGVDATEYGRQPSGPNFAPLARSFGLYSVVADGMAELDQALRLTFTHDGPALITARIRRHEVGQPARASLEHMTNVALSATRGVLSGHGDDLVELDETNLHELALP